MTATLADAADSPPYAEKMAPSKRGARKGDENEEMEATKKKGANNEEDNSTRSGAKKNLSLMGEGRPHAAAAMTKMAPWRSRQRPRAAQ